MLTSFLGSSGGASSPQLPQWTFVSGGGNPTAGTFTANDPSAASTTQLNLADTDPDGAIGWASFIESLSGVQAVILKDDTGKSVCMSVSSVADNGAGNLRLFVTDAISLGGYNWIGKYSFQFLTSAGNTFAPDGTYSPVTSITIVKGLITEIS